MSKGSVLICSPVFFEQFLAHATQRRLADDLARSGFTALRFDYRASGDSTGSPDELQDVEVWLDDIAAAVDWLRARGASWVALVGMRFGANLLAAASARTGADACVLWDPVASGKALVRQAILLHRAALREDAEWSNAGPLLSTDNNVAGLGFGYPASFIRSVEKVGLDALSPQAQALVVTRDGHLPTALSARKNLEILTAIGQEDLIDRPLSEGVIPEITATAVVAWLNRTVGDHPCDLMDQSTLDTRCEMTLANGVTIFERTIRLGDLGLFGIVSEPAAEKQEPNALTCLFFNAGLQHHIGPHRLWVDITRRLAGSSIEAIRFDGAGIGDSPNRDPYPPGRPFSIGALDDIDAVLADFTERPVTLVGLSSGGYHVLEAAAKHPVRGVVSIHGAMHDLWLNAESTSNDPRRTVFVPDRPWIRRLAPSRTSSSIGASKPISALKRRWMIEIAWRFPAAGWRLLDRLHLQADVGRGWLRSLDQGAEVVMLIEHRRLQYPRAWAFHQRPQPPNLVVIPSRADHSLFGPADRLFVANLVCAYVRRWADHTEQ
jgi:pimeloyl-ACP methyl ester carboxylesterase